jgi:hypothetical protein
MFRENGINLAMADSIALPIHHFVAISGQFTLSAIGH